MIKPSRVVIASLVAFDFLTVSTNLMAQQFAVGAQGGVQNGVRQYELNTAVLAFGAKNYNSGLLVEYRPEIKSLQRPLTVSLGLLASTRRYRVLNTPEFTSLEALSYDYISTLTPEISLAGTIRLLTFRPGKEMLSQFAFDAGIGLVVGGFTKAELCYRYDGEPCTESTANFKGETNGGSNIDPFAQLNLYWDSDKLWPTFRMRTGFATLIHPANLSRYRIDVNYGSRSASENAEINRSAARLYLLWVLPSKKVS